ncbi:hypothetical protein C3B60_06935 [Cryobacterium zongtaii]|nr:hypothetical protein C3B60_06935 [Cryobacterium zongtaii]
MASGVSTIPVTAAAAAGAGVSVGTGVAVGLATDVCDGSGEAAVPADPSPAQPVSATAKAPISKNDRARTIDLPRDVLMCSC